ncbi:MAG: DnaJ domain-containing protein [Patescibacteria group bacterium]
MPRKSRSSVPKGQSPDFLDKINQTIEGLGSLFGQFQEMRREDARSAGDPLNPLQPEQYSSRLTVYQVLGVDPDTPVDTIKSRWRKLCAIYHPDGGASDDSMFKKVNAAWEQIQRDKGLK